MSTIANKVLITGATGGIGSALCKKFLDEKYILLLSSSSDEKLELLRNKYGESNFYYKLDFADFDQLEINVKKISNEHKDISVIVNNAGITADSLILRMKSDSWHKVIKTNLDSNYYIIKSLLPNMLSRRYGKIVGISSVIASTGNPGQANYAASKSGMIGFYKSIAHEVAKRKINVNVVSPGYIKTPMTDNLDEKQQNEILSKIPMQIFGEPEDVANLVYFLSSSEASYITGQNFNVNGGMLMF